MLENDANVNVERSKILLKFPIIQLTGPRRDRTKEKNWGSASEREREELEQVKNQRDQMMEEVRIAKEEKTLLKSQYEELKKTTDELQIKLALKEAEELRRKQAGDSRHMTKFSLSEIEKATQGFNESLRIGIGGYGSVYKGLLCQNEVAIKMLQSDSQQGPAEFRREVCVLIWKSVE